MEIEEQIKKMAEEVVLRATKELLGRTVLNLLDSDGHAWSKRPCTTCQTVSEIVGQPFGCVKKAMQPEARANFLWPYDDGSVEEAGYEFANAKTEAYRRQWWEILVARVREDEAEDHR